MYRNLRGFELQKSATISAMDAGVGRVYDALKQENEPCKKLEYIYIIENNL